MWTARGEGGSWKVHVSPQGEGGYWCCPRGPNILGFSDLEKFKDAAKAKIWKWFLIIVLLALGQLFYLVVLLVIMLNWSLKMEDFFTLLLAR